MWWPRSSAATDGARRSSASARLDLEIDRAVEPRALFEAVRAGHDASFLLDGDARFEESWGPLVGLEPRRLPMPPDPDEALRRLDALIARRRRRGGAPGCGVAALLPYEFLERPVHLVGREDRFGIEVLEIDASVSFPPSARPRLALRSTGRSALARESKRWLERIDRLAPAPQAPPRLAGRGPLRTSLPRDAYLEAVRSIKRHIRHGDIYQANLTQRFRAGVRADAFAVHRALVAAAPAPRSAFFEAGQFAVATVSPEVFVSIRPDGGILTRPIKGTRPRGRTPEEDRRAAADLLASEKDRAELVMIVDLERNDLGRICRTGTVRVPEIATLRSYPAVHHLVACVEGQLRPETGPGDWIRAVFPGGSITGAPKIRAMEILRALEPVGRGFYTGSLFWFGDDGTTDSSILIRSAVVAAGRVSIGAGGGVVADSEPEAEWAESNDKARALLSVLGFVPEEAV